MSEVLNVTQTIENRAVSFIDSDGIAYKTLVTGTADGIIIQGLNIASTDTAARNLLWALNDGTTDFIQTATNVPITAGTTGAIQSVDGLSSLWPSAKIDNNGKRILALKSPWTLKVRPLVAVTATFTIDVTAYGEGF